MVLTMAAPTGNGAQRRVSFNIDIVQFRYVARGGNESNDTGGPEK